MSKPNLLRFSTSVGFYRNKRVLDLEGLLGKYLPGKIERAKLAPTCFQIVMAYAAENQIDGNFDGYTPTDWSRIFAMNNLPFTVPEATNIVKAFREVGLFDGSKIRSWMKYNRHLADYEGIVRSKRKAGKILQQKRQQEARERHVDPSKNGEETAPKTVQKPVQKDSPSRQLFELNQAIEVAPTAKAKATLKRKKIELLSAQTGVDLSMPPSRSPAPPSAKTPNKTAEEIESEQLVMAQTTLKDFPDALSDHAVTTLVKHGFKLPSAVRSRFRALLAQLQSNPVPE
jgi:hypothetical protein